jgi:hypothetical protein
MRERGSELDVGADRITPEQVMDVAATLGLDGVEAQWDDQGEVQVRLSIRALCSLAECLCASMSEFDLDGYAEHTLRETAKMAEVSRQIMGRRKTE